MLITMEENIYSEFDPRNPQLPLVMNAQRDNIMGFSSNNSIQQERALQVQEKALQAQREENPFAIDQYRAVNLPDQPIAYNGGMAEQLLSDEGVPKWLKEKYWNVFHKDNVLTFLDEKTKASKMLNFDIMKIDMLNSMPYFDYTFEKEFGIFDVYKKTL